jgi:hypothetical protein
LFLKDPSAVHPPVRKIGHILYLHELLDVEQYFYRVEVRLNRIEEWLLSPLGGRQTVYDTARTSANEIRIMDGETNAMQCCSPMRSPFILHTAIAPVRSYN